MEGHEDGRVGGWSGMRVEGQEDGKEYERARGYKGSRMEG